MLRIHPLFFSATLAALTSCALVSDFDFQSDTSVGGSAPGGEGGAGASGGAGNGGGGESGGGGGVASCAVASCTLGDAGCPEVVSAISVSAVVADSEAFYAFDHGAGQIRKFARPGCSVEPFSLTYGQPDAIALHQGKLYWTHRNPWPAVVRCDAADCERTAESVLTGATVGDTFNSVVPDGDSLFIGRVNGEIGRLTPAQDDLYEVVVHDVMYPAPGLQLAGLRHVGDTLVWLRHQYDAGTSQCGTGVGGYPTDCTGAVEVFTLGGAAPEELVTGLYYPTSLAADETYAYYRSVVPEYLLHRVPIAGGPEEALPTPADLHNFGGFNYDVRPHGDWVYLAARDANVQVVPNVYAPVIVRTKKTDFSAVQIVVGSDRVGAGIDGGLTGYYIEGTSQHTLYWTAGATYWRATVPGDR